MEDAGRAQRGRTPLTRATLDPMRGPRVRPGSDRARGRAAAADRGAYPGSFNPLTTAHLAIAAAARTAHRLAEVHLVVSRRPLGKDDVEVPLLQHRLEVLEHAVATRPWLRVVVTEAQLLTDIARGYGVVIMGADKWHQIHDPGFYDSIAARDAAVAQLPTPAVAPRPPHEAPAEHLLRLDDDIEGVSSTAARAGDHSVMAPEAIAFDRRTGAWSDVDRYRSWVGSGSTADG